MAGPDHQLACGGRRTISGIQECSHVDRGSKLISSWDYSQFTIVDGTAVELFNYFITNNK